MPRNNKFVVTGILAVISLLSVASMWDNNIVLFVMLLSTSVLMLSVEKSKQEVETFIFSAVFGASAECIAIIFGAWTYSNPDLFNIPIWLPFLWGIAAVFMVRVYKYFSK